MTVTLRKALPGDRDFAFRARKAAFQPYVEKAFGWNEGAQQQLHAERFGVQEFRIISVAGLDVGVMALEKSHDCVRLNQLFLLPEYQGREIGRRSMSVVMDEARALGLPIRLRVLRVNPRARKFYERLGFKLVGESDDHDLLAWGIS
jgi:GNAT superfamily N-acetyltransferase